VLQCGALLRQEQLYALLKEYRVLQRIAAWRSVLQRGAEM